MSNFRLSMEFYNSFQCFKFKVVYVLVSILKLFTIYFFPNKCSLFKRDALRNLVPFVQFKKREKHPWMSVTFSKLLAISLIVILLHGCLLCVLNCTSGTK